MHTHTHTHKHKYSIFALSTQAHEHYLYRCTIHTHTHTSTSTLSSILTHTHKHKYSIFALSSDTQAQVLTHTSTLSLCTISLHYPHKHKNTIFLHYPHKQQVPFPPGHLHCHSQSCTLHHRVRPIVVSVTTPLLLNMFSLCVLF